MAHVTQFTGRIAFAIGAAPGSLLDLCVSIMRRADTFTESLFSMRKLDEFEGNRCGFHKSSVVF
jgi:hypothetical protein